MIHYININKKRLVGRNNQPSVQPICLDYSTIEPLSFQFINDNNQIQELTELSGLYFAGSLSMGQMSYDLLFLCKDYSIADNTLTFQVDTYTINYLNKIRKKNTVINIEIGQIDLDNKRVMLRDTALAMPRVYVAGLSPAEIESKDYYTKTEVDELIEGATSGAVQKDYVDEHDTILQEQITALDEDKQDAITEDSKLDYALLSGTPTIPTKTSDLQNDSGFTTETYVDDAVSGKADKTELEDYQKKITNNSKLDYVLLSGTPSIPTKTSDLQNDSGFATSTYVDDAVSGKADKTELEDYQKLITSTSKLDYELLSGTPAEYNPVDVSLEMKTATTAGTFTGSFEGKQIQKWVYIDATSGSIAIDVSSFSSTATDIAPTTELHVPINGNVTTITTAASLSIIDIPDTLEYKGETANDIQYEVFVIRSVKDMNGVWKFYLNYAYSYIETITA